MHHFKNTGIWKKSRLFCSDIYDITASFSGSKKFGLTNQLRKVSVSIPYNITEDS